MATVHQVPRSVRRRLLRTYRKTRDHATALRMLVCLKLLGGRSKADVARDLGLAPSSVVRISVRFEEGGIEGLYDRRVFNGPLKVDEGFKRHLALILRDPPTAFGWQRTTWTRELLCMQMEHDGFDRVAVCTMGRALYEIGARLKAPKPIVRCPWPANRRKQRLAELRDLVEHTPASEPVYYSDEVDIHLNPRIGRDWMPRGHRRMVVTPGRNRKHYLAGALNARTGELVWVDGDQKASWLFCKLLWRLAGKHRRAKRIHLIVDNYCIHDSHITRKTLAQLGNRIQLHFLPPYCPDHNPIERTWKALHDNVTRNHRCKSMSDLLDRVSAFLIAYNGRAHVNPSLLRAA